MIRGFMARRTGVTHGTTCSSGSHNLISSRLVNECGEAHEFTRGSADREKCEPSEIVYQLLGIRFRYSVWNAQQARSEYAHRLHGE